MARREELTAEQWSLIEPLFDEADIIQTRCRLRRTEREVLDGILWILRFRNKQKIADFSKRLTGEVFNPLKNQSYFWKSFVDGQAIAWSTGADLAPETLYLESESVLS